MADTEDQKDKEQKFCGIIQQTISVSTCPLKHGVCMWRHRNSGECQYTDTELTAEEFCSRVGLEVPSNAELEEIRNTIVSVLKNHPKL
jgi:hypothetical protein